MQDFDQEKQRVIIYTAKQVAIVAMLFVLCGLIFLSINILDVQQQQPVTPSSSAGISTVKFVPADTIAKAVGTKLWQAPAVADIPAGEAGEAIRYGRELIAHTAKYFGPRGKIARISNGMNCQNCHLEAGTKVFANNYAVFFANYPKQGIRSGKTDQVTDRISDCFTRSLGGRMPPKNSKEIKAMISYFKWLGAATKRGEKVNGTSTEKLPYLDRAADPEKGRFVYQQKCKSCHGLKGEGLKTADQLSYVYPPLWGKNSYTDAAGMYRISNFAGFVKNNMPFGADYHKPQLSNEEAWDVAAYVNTRPRLHRDQRKDYPDLSRKPIDAPFGPYPDEFSEQQHKLGPFKPIVDYAKRRAGKGNDFTALTDLKGKKP